METMPVDLYRKVISDAKSIGVRRFVLTGYGEIFTAKNYRFFVQHLEDEIPDALIRIVTNGSLLNDEAIDFILSSRLYRVDISIDGATAETYESIRRRLRFGHVVDNTKKLIAAKRRSKKAYPKIRVNIVSQPQNEHELADFLSMWQGEADYVGDHFLLSRLGAVENAKERGETRPCILLWTEMNVWSNGDVVICSDDWNGTEVMGSIKTESLLDIWRGDRFIRYRQLHQSGRAGEIAACGKCSSFRLGPAWFQKRPR